MSKTYKIGTDHISMEAVPFLISSPEMLISYSYAAWIYGRSRSDDVKMKAASRGTP